LKIDYHLLNSIFLDYRFLTSQWELVARRYWAAVTSDAAIEVGGGEADLQQTGHADWADLLCIRLATRRLLSCKMKLRHLRTFYDPHTPIPDGQPHRLIYLPHPTRETDLSREHSVSCRECGKGRGERRVVNNRCETMSSQSPAVSALSAIWWHWHVTSVVNIICCMQARSLLVSCITVSLANWGQSYDCLPQSVPGA